MTDPLPSSRQSDKGDISMKFALKGLEGYRVWTYRRPALILVIMKKQRFEIPEHILKKTRCEKGFSCLSGRRKNLCKIVDCVSGKVYFLEALNDKYCPYAKIFGDSYYCTCPTRMKIYDIYRV
jgi:hypothetical protein